MSLGHSLSHSVVSNGSSRFAIDSSFKNFARF
jgi:hypothetical protein